MSTIDLISTGVPGLDRVLGGGLPALSFNVIGGHPGAGKTTLAHQICFANATRERPALFFTVVGEPPIKMLRYQQQFDFFDVDKVGSAIHFQNLADQVVEGDLDAVFQGIIDEVGRLEPGLVVVDSFRSVARMINGDRRMAPRSFQDFVQHLSNQMTRWEATTFLLGEFHASESPHNPVFTVADGVLWLRHHWERDARVRKLEVGKLRGKAELPGEHTYRIDERGLRVYPRLILPLPPRDDPVSGRVSLGVPKLDEIMGGGAVPADAILVSGPSGCGKSILGMQFLTRGLKAGERVVAATFEESLPRYRARAALLGVDLEAAEEEGRAILLRRRPLDLSMDETFEGIRNAVEEIGATRAVVDSLSGLQVVTSGAEGARLRASMARVIQTLTEGGCTVLMTTELNQRSDQLRFTPQESSFLADDILLMRYVEIHGELQTVLSVVKMRRSAHDRAFHRYGITESGLVLGERLEKLRGILTGVPEVGGRPRDDDDWEAVARRDPDVDASGGTGSAKDDGAEG